MAMCRTAAIGGYELSRVLCYIIWRYDTWLLTCINARFHGGDVTSMHFDLIIPPATKLGGVYWNHHVRPSVRPSVCPSVRLSGRIWVSGA